MAGQLVQVATNTVSSAVSSVTLTGIDSDDVYMDAFNNVVPATDNTDMRFRVTESGTPNTTANYDRASKLIRANTSFGNQSATNETSWDLGANIGTATGEATNGIMYIYNANNSSEYTFMTKEIVELNQTPELIAQQGGGVFTSTSTVNGLSYFFSSSGNITSGTFTLYKVV